MTTRSANPHPAAAKAAAAARSGVDDDSSVEDVLDFGFEDDPEFADLQAGPVHLGHGSAHTSHEATEALANADIELMAMPWLNAYQLEAPEPMPGMEQRWIRAQIGNAADRANLHLQSRKGWLPRPLSTIPQFYIPPAFNSGADGGVLQVGTLILCHRPKGIGVKWREIIRSRAEMLRGSVEHHLDKIQVPAMPFTQQSKTEVTFGRAARYGQPGR